MKWEDRLKRAEKAKCFTEEDVKLAQLWITCPISEFADQIELREGKLDRGPIDMYLILDSIYFCKGVEDDNVGLAINCHKAIVAQVEALKNGTDRTTRLKEFLGKYY